VTQAAKPTQSRQRSARRKPVTPAVELDLSIEAPQWESWPGLEADCRLALDAALAVADRKVMAGAELALVLTDDAAIREVNRDWRGFDKPTNVLSFPGAPVARLACSPHLGDVVVACETLMREAADEERPPRHHLIHLVIHGVLHCLGYDHETPQEAHDMESRETRALAGLGIPDPYAGSDPVEAAPIREAAAPSAMD
jgi:probable rRNA maturation factor